MRATVTDGISYRTIRLQERGNMQTLRGTLQVDRDLRAARERILASVDGSPTVLGSFQLRVLSDVLKFDLHRPGRYCGRSQATIVTLRYHF